MQLETWTEADLDEVVHLLNAVSPYDRFTLAQVRQAIFDDPDLDPGLLLRAREGDATVGVVAAVARRSRTDPAAPPIGYVKLIAVAPSRQRMGVGRRLADAAEEGLAARSAAAVRVFADTPAWLKPGVDFRLTGLVCFLLGRGYAFQRNAVNMDVDLHRESFDTAADERRLADVGITIRRLAVSDAAAFERYMAESWSWGWRVEATRTVRRVPIATHVALARGPDGERFVGFASANATGPGHFGPMGVAEEFRRHGIGAVLLKRCLVDLRDLGYSTGEIQWVGPIGFYARQVGAVLSRCFWQMEKPPGH